MALKSPHRDWRLDLVNPIDIRAVGLDQLLTRLWLRILHGNRPLLPRPGAAQQVSELANLIEGSETGFRQFAENPGAAESWLRADLVKTLRRTPEKFTVARPVHALAARIRSIDKQTDDSLASLVVYSWLSHVDPGLLPELRVFIDVAPEAEERVDLATLALAVLGAEQPADQLRSDEPDSCPPPLCLGQARDYADDARRMLAYAPVMPRAALVEHLRRLTGFHLGLYLLRVFRIAVDVERNGTPRCLACSEGRAPAAGEVCPYRLELLVDCGEDARSPVAKLAEKNWGAQEDALARYIRSHLALRKLYEFGEHLHKSKGVALPKSLQEIASLEHHGDLVDVFFAERIDRMQEDAKGEVAQQISELGNEYRSQGLSVFRVYVALLTHFSERRWFNYHRYLIDSLFSKNSTDGLLRQPLGGPRRRRAAIGAALLETLALIAVVDGEPGDFFTRPLQVDQLIQRLDNRYDLLVARPPTDLANDLEATRQLAVNVERFKARLRESGLFTDLSDAFLAQLVRPRHHLEGAK
jgi:hypothetical protein